MSYLFGCLFDQVFASYCHSYHSPPLSLLLPLLLLLPLPSSPPFLQELVFEEVPIPLPDMFVSEWVLILPQELHVE